LSNASGWPQAQKKRFMSAKQQPTCQQSALNRNARHDGPAQVLRTGVKKLQVSKVDPGHRAVAQDTLQQPVRRAPRLRPRARSLLRSAFHAMEGAGMSDDNRKAQGDAQRNQGEGDKASAKRYNEAQRQFVQSDRGQQAIDEAGDMSSEEARAAERAEAEGRARAKAEDPAVTRDRSEDRRR